VAELLGADLGERPAFRPVRRDGYEYRHIVVIVDGAGPTAIWRSRRPAAGTR